MKRNYFNKESLFFFSENTIGYMKKIGKMRTAETYASSVSSFKRFLCGADIKLKDLDSETMMEYEAYLKSKGLSSNTSSFYMRNLRAIYNRAVEKGLITDKTPFKRVYTGIDKTFKRAVNIGAIKKIKEIKLDNDLSFARDIFLFSFYTRGMSFIDIAYLKKKNIKSGMLIYHRRKTNQQLMIKWENCMQRVVEKYSADDSEYLFPIISEGTSANEQRRDYMRCSQKINRGLKRIGDMAGIPITLTMYVARHSWASIAKSKNIPISIISEGMGHDSEATTRIYLTTLDTMAVDRANEMILSLL